MKGKRVVVPGASNRAMVTFAKFLPRRLLTEVTGRIQNPDQQQQETPVEEFAVSN
ncbi:hypothetical protein [Exiguobacterium artemiae]